MEKKFQFKVDVTSKALQKAWELMKLANDPNINAEELLVFADKKIEAFTGLLETGIFWGLRRGNNSDKKSRNHGEKSNQTTG